MKLGRRKRLLLVLSLLVLWMMIFSVSAMEEETQLQETETTGVSETEETTEVPTEVPTEPATEPATEEITEAPTEQEESPTETPAPGGTFGMNNMQWKLDGNTLYITGNGYMNGWNGGEYPPWYTYRDRIYKVVMSGNIENIWSYSFSNCIYLSEIVWPSGVNSIFDFAFYNCQSLKRITVPGTVGYISEYAFASCGATTITLKSGVRFIGAYAFSNCSQLQSMTIPATVTEISGGAFSYCESLRTINFTGNMPKMIIDEPYLPWTFGNIYDVTVYYPGSNRTWTATKLQKLSKQHQPQNVVFKSTTGETVEQPTEEKAVSDSAQTTENGATHQGNQETTVPETTTIPVPEASVPEGTVNTEPSVEPMETVEQETNPQPTEVTTDRSDKKPKTAVWIVVASAGALTAAIVVACIVIKKIGKLGK